MTDNKFELQPVTTEKSYLLANAQNKYVFLVKGSINKIEIANEVEKKYKVKVEKVNTVVRPGKLRRDLKTYRSHREEDQTKAIVTLKKGDKIDEFLNI
ncbi:MAG: 50S ribosomal protein L23 [Candidatus Dojkabacteria bacterium]|jgi:large subunit ribosomal protein L23